MRLNLSAPRPDQPAETHDVVLDAEPGVTVGELAAALRLPAQAIAPGADPEAEVASTGVVSGVRLPLAAPADLPPGTVRLEIVGGPFGGDVVALPAGASISAGSGPDSLLQIVDPALELVHATLDVARENANVTATPAMTITPAAQDAVVLVNGAPITEATQVGPDDVVQLGASLVRIGRQPRRDADISPEGLGRVAFNRASRIQPGHERPSVRMPGDRPTAAERSPLPWLSALLPVVIGVAMAFAFKQPIMLLMAAASPVMVIGNNVTSRRSAQRSGRRTVAKWKTEIAEARERLAEVADAQRVRAWAQDGGPVALADIATTPTARLWERRSTEPDALRVRIGAGESTLDASLDGARTTGSDAARLTVSPTPVTVDLAAGVVGVAGPRAVVTALTRAMIVGLATTRSPRDLAMVLLCDQSAEDDWAFARWLPHLDGSAAALAAIGNTSDTRLARLRELTALLEARQAAVAARSSTRFDQHVVAVIDQARSYRTLPGMVGLLEHGPSVGISVIAIEDDRSRLPEEASCEILVDPAAPLVARVEAAAGSSTESASRVLLDQLTPERAETIARALAPLVHVGGVGDDNLLPQSVRFVDLAAVDLDDPQPLVSRWSYSPRETRAVVGAGADGEFALDLALDGPHGLVAGTTGAGKSEFLQTLVVSLALANRPDALNFVLVDYKGGSAFADCERLPHTTGLVTNLDGRETERALESLDAELKRREHVLRDMGAKDADAAWERDPDQAAARGMARLVLVIDEFAELKTELPDFVSGLVRIARVGRSLGVHLILATQRPSGAITPEMQSNTNLRVALRVTDKADSTDILGSGEAALISTSTPGRGYARRGVGAAPAGFQTARVAGRRPGVVHATTSAPAALSRSWREVGAPVVFPKKAAAAAGPIDHDDTDLRALVAVIQRAADELGVAKNPSPWLLPLPGLLTLDDVTQPVAQGAVVIGLEDVPSEQAQRPLTWSVVDDSHLSFVGGARSGRTSTLRSLVAQLAMTHAPADLHLYGIDYGNGGLGPMAGLPHTGALITPLEQGRLPRFVTRLLTEIGRRQGVLSRDSFGDISEHRAALTGSEREHERLPYVVVALDGWERLASDLGPDDMIGFREQMVRILREGPAVGIRLVVTGDRALINDKVSGFIDTRYVLPLTDREDYRMAGIPIRGLPAEIGAGRVFFGTPLREVQVALLPGEATGEGQTATFRAIVDEVRATADAAPAALRPFRVDVMPGEISLQAASELPPAAGSAADGIDIGVGGDALARYRIDVAAARGFLVVGERRSGRSTALGAIVAQFAGTGQPAVVVSLRDSPLRAIATRLGVPVVSDPAISRASLTELLAPLADLGRGPVAVVVDDVETLKDQPVETLLLDEKAGLFFVVSTHTDEAGGLFRGLFPEAKKARQGVLLSAANAMNGTQTFGAPLPRPLQGKAPAGRAALFWDGTYTEVQVPLP